MQIFFESLITLCSLRWLTAVRVCKSNIHVGGTKTKCLSFIQVYRIRIRKLDPGGKFSLISVCSVTLDLKKVVNECNQLLFLLLLSCCCNYSTRDMNAVSTVFLFWLFSEHFIG